MTATSEQTLLITGANSFVGGHIIQNALEKGYNVRGTVRSESSAAKVHAIFDKYASQLSVKVVSDITKPELYESAFAGATAPITGVISVAAPFALKVDDNRRDLLDPAVNGAIGILEATKRYGSDVRRLVNTSSFASIFDMSKGYRPGYTYNETDWNPMTYEEASTADGSTAYCASKALAEKAMWNWADKEQPAFSLTMINPPWVFGPHIGGITLGHLNESTEALWNLLGAEKVPAIDFGGFADARVVAAAHIAAFETPEAGGQRFLVGQHFDYQSAVDLVRVEFPSVDNRLPVGTPGQLEPVYALDGSKAERVLGVKYIPLGTTMKDSLAELLEAEKKN